MKNLEIKKFYGKHKSYSLNHLQLFCSSPDENKGKLQLIKHL